MKYVTTGDFPIGTLAVTEDGAGICAVHVLPDAAEPSCGAEEFERKETPLLRRALVQLGEYFAGTRRTFDLPLSLKGTEFQLRVWNELLRIPYGKTTTYGRLAYRVGNAKACRAVGMANHRNPVMIIVPCHRVIGADGSLTGYAGGLNVKRLLLDLEAGFQALDLR
ncbi:methylated-DNA--[protein]-cysteine S-methyltransferase [Treponema brennaborense]|nr:methylated-DNA--[protein]-cysteine S-methyltransferase [Treponema brennaborense]